ncbi:MAG: hypothetical protein CEE40_10335 [Chloroflexi bacterium B3_Chlor]|nr:MAG: hypothetical protein CEE40_10335 [Chloroflexi bacterium B3_Chlor]
MKCYKHPDVDAVAACTTCGKALCETCSVDLAGRISCRECLAAPPAEGGAGTFSQMNPLSIASVVLGAIGIFGLLCGGSIGGLVFGIPAALTAWVSHKSLLETQLQRSLPAKDILKSFAGQRKEPVVDQTGSGELALTRVGFWLGFVETVLSGLFIILSLFLVGTYCGVCSLAGLCENLSY